jgi:hypothetical protein
MKRDVNVVFEGSISLEIELLAFSGQFATPRERFVEPRAIW